MNNEYERIRVGQSVSIYQRGKRKIWVADSWRDGVHHRQSLKTGNTKVAVQRATLLDAELVSGNYQHPPKPVAIVDAAKGYLSYLKTEDRAAKTISKYRGVLALFDTFLGQQRVFQLHQVRLAHFDQFRTARKQQSRHAKTLYTEGVILKQFFKWSKSRKLITENPLDDVKLKKPKLEPRGGPDLNQVNRILAVLTEQKRTMVAILAFTGMRAGDLQRLKPEDIDFDRNWLHVKSRVGAETKTRESRRVPIHSRLMPLLSAMSRGSREWVFTMPVSRKYPNGGHRLDMKKLNESFVATLRKLQLPAGRKSGGFTLHSLRHLFETFAIDNRIPQRVVDTWLGHRSDKSMAANY